MTAAGCPLEHDASANLGDKGSAATGAPLQLGGTLAAALRWSAGVLLQGRLLSRTERTVSVYLGRCCKAKPSRGVEF